MYGIGEPARYIAVATLCLSMWACKFSGKEGSRPCMAEAYFLSRWSTVPGDILVCMPP